ncbi:hypothetical protein NMY22_g18269 [Coprinellus aureogranulatus]|nr:hypothetical protein NMY22_g18269 [Coprinellus aureogranulatus]
MIKHLELRIVQIDCFRSFLGCLSDVDALWKQHMWDSLASFHLKIMDYSRSPGFLPANFHQVHGGWHESHENCGSLFEHLPSNSKTFLLNLPGVDHTFSLRPHSRDAGLYIPHDILGRFTTFTIRCDWDGDHLMNMLKHCTDVQTLNLDFNRRGIYPTDEQMRVPVVLPHVRRLRFRDAAGIDFLLGIRTPALQELDLSLGVNYVGTDVLCECLCGYLVDGGNASHLKSLRLSDFRLSTTDLSPLFAPLRRLEYLTLDKVAEFGHGPTWKSLQANARDSPPSSFEAFNTMNAAEYCWLPSLKHLELLRLQSDCTLQGAIAYLEARKGSPLCRVVASFSIPPEQEGDYDLHHLKRSGIFLSIVPVSEEVFEEWALTI